MLCWRARKVRGCASEPPRLSFVRRTASRFIPGETLDDGALGGGRAGAERHRHSVTHLGENITDAAEARNEALHYGEVQGRIRDLGLPTELSIKLTQLGLDLGATRCYENLARIIENAGHSHGVDRYGIERLCGYHARAIPPRALALSQRRRVPAGLSVPDGKGFGGADAARARRSGW